MKVLVLRSRHINSVISIISVLVFVFTTVGVMIAANSNRLLPIYCTENDKKQIAITFDAAWDDSNVDDLIALMKKYKVKSTVFAVGDWIEKYPQAVKKLSDAGHEIGNHSDKHFHLKNMSSDDFIADVKACNDRIEKLTGKNVSLYRGPYGEYNNMSVTEIKNLGMYYIQWDCDSRDWKPEFTTQDIIDSAMKNVQSGSIMLLHIGAVHTVEALEVILHDLKKDGYEFVTVSDLILKDNYTIDHTGKQITIN